jgi:hypothetical protein
MPFRTYKFSTVVLSYYGENKSPPAQLLLKGFKKGDDEGILPIMTAVSF